MQMVERDLVNLDDDISTLLPELKDIKVLKGFEEDKGGRAILEKASNPITLRLRITPTCGAGFTDDR